MMNKLSSFGSLFTVFSIAAFLSAGSNAKNVADCAADNQENNSPLVTSGRTSYTNYLDFYFDNLTNNFGKNYAGSCGYVALGMLLSYYDSFFDDNLVPQTYTQESVGIKSNLIDRRNSPGVKHDDFASMGYSSIYGNSFPGTSQYLNYVFSIANTSLHAKLIQIGNSLGYYGGDGDNPASTTPEEREAILSTYLTTVVGLSSSDFSITTTAVPYALDMFIPPFQTAAMQEIKTLVSSGHPVLVGLRSSWNSSRRHAVIAYDFNQNENKLYLHYGLNSDVLTTHAPFGAEGYDVITSYSYIDFAYSADPGENYCIKLGNSSINCAYNSPSINWNTTHNHTYGDSYLNFDSSCHKSFCECGDFILDYHFSFDATYYAHHMVGNCDYCGEYFEL